LWDIAREEYDANRIVFSEYHAVAAPTGAFMIRKGRFKLIYYVNYHPQLFDIESNCLEKNELSSNSEYSEILSQMQKELHSVCDPDEVDRRAKNDQATLVKKHGGRDAVIARGIFFWHPGPGRKANLRVVTQSALGFSPSVSQAKLHPYAVNARHFVPEKPVDRHDRGQYLLGSYRRNV